MKIRPGLLICLFILSFISLHAQKGVYEFETAYVEKTTTTSSSGVDVTATEKIYISDHGKKVATYRTEKRKIKSLKKTEESSLVSVLDGDWVIKYDPKTRQGTKTKNILSDKFKNLSEEDAKKMEKGMKDALHAETKELGTESILGKKCNVVQAVTSFAGMKTNTKTWTYKNFLMKSESEGMGSKVKEEVTVFKEGEKIDKNMFVIPKDIKLKEVKF